MLDNSYRIVSLNKDDFNFCAYSDYVLVEFLANKVLTCIYCNLVKRT